MAFNAGSIVATLRLKKDKFTASLRGAGKQVEGFGKKMLKVSNLIRIAFGAAAVREVVNFGRALFDAVSRGANLNTVSDAFDRMAASAGTSSRKVIADVKAITGALSNRDIMQAANMLELLGVGLENVPRFVEIARSAAIALNKPLNFMLESLATGTARQSRLWLDNLGIIISVEQANKDYAASLGRVASSLTDTEKRAAFLNAVLLKGDDIIKKIGATGETQGEKVQKLGAAFTNFTDQLARIAANNLAEPMGEIATAMERMADAADRMDKGGAFQRFMIGRGGPSFIDPTSPRFGPNFGGGFPVSIKHKPAPLASILDPSKGLPDVSRFDPNEAFIEFLKRLGVAQRLGIFDVSTRPGGGGRGSGFGGPIDDPGISTGADNMSELNTQFALGDSLLQTLGNSAEQFFATLASGSDDAGKAFAAFILGGVADVASGMGSMLISTGLGMLSLSALNPFAAISAGLALKALAGVFRGESQRNAPQAPPQIGGVGEFRPTGPQGDDFGGPNVTIIVQGDMLGDPIMMDRLFERINRHLRGGATLQLQGG